MKIFLATIIIASGAAVIAYSSSVEKIEPPFTWEKSTVVENPVSIAIPEISDEPIIPDPEPQLSESVTHVVRGT